MGNTRFDVNEPEDMGVNACHADDDRLTVTARSDAAPVSGVPPEPAPVVVPPIDPDLVARLVAGQFRGGPACR